MRARVGFTSVLLIATLAGTGAMPLIGADLVLAASAPDAVDDTPAHLLEDAPATTIPVLANDSDADHDPLRIVAVTQGAAGSVAIAGGGSTLTYHPAPDVNGPDTFTYTIEDRRGQDTATVQVTVDPVNDAPSFTLGPTPSVPENSGAVMIPGFATAQAGPSNESSQALTYVLDGYTSVKLFTAPPAISPAGDLTFTLAPDVSTMATATFHLVDNGPHGGANVNVSPEQTFVIDVTSVPAAPVAVDDGPIMVHKDTPSGFYNVRHNDEYDYYDAIVVDTDVTHGVLNLDPDSGNFTYVPDSGYVGPDSFTYHLHAGALVSNVATVRLTVYVNHAPVAVADNFTVITTRSGSELAVLANDLAANPDQGEFLTITRASRPAHGSVSFDITSLFYVPKAGFYGTDAFTYTISDGISTATASVHVKVLRDTFRPVSMIPTQKVIIVGSATATMFVTFCASDVGTGSARNELWESVNGHPYVRLFNTSGCVVRVTAKVGSTIRFRARATDWAGNVGLFTYGPRFTLKLYQETSATFPVPWQSVAHSVYLGGRESRTTTAGADAVFTSIGRSFTWVGTRPGGQTPGWGRADVYVDGAWTARVDTRGSYTTIYHAVLFTCSFADSGRHTIRIVNYDPGMRINIDGFLVLR